MAEKFSKIDLTQCREILEEIHRKRLSVAGGSGRRPRYEMRDTILYFNLGRVLINLIDKYDGGPDRRSALLARIVSKLQEEFDDSENVFRWSIRFVQAFQDEEYYNEVSRFCHQSFGQLREVVEILGKDNPLGISSQDLEAFKQELSKEITYEEMRKLCMKLKAKYVAEWKYQIDSADLQDLFDRVLKNIQEIMEQDDSAVRSGWRDKVSVRSITTFRHLLLLLSREVTLESVSKRDPKVLEAVGRARGIRDGEMSKLYEILLKFLQGGQAARERLRKIIPPVDMGYLQTMLKALASEEDYVTFKKTEELMKRINF